ncbi:S8 family serine peptidase [Nonomuraea sp. NPDC049141]|uniref:S8 family serine peptidase n=1 Tax=Nonomuraea sp. NPDC049141 TaxID=3155500 RepID=UPI0033C7E272
MKKENPARTAVQIRQNMLAAGGDLVVPHERTLQRHFLRLELHTEGLDPAATQPEYEMAGTVRYMAVETLYVDQSFTEHPSVSACGHAAPSRERAKGMSVMKRHVWPRQGVKIGVAGLVAAVGLGLATPAGASAAGNSAIRDTDVSDPGFPGTQIDPPRGLDRLDQRDQGNSNTYSWRTTGRNVHAYVLGDKISTTHTTFGGRAVNGPDFTGAPQCPLWDNWGTGLASAVGGTRHGVAKEVPITGVRIMACGTTTPDRLIQGMDWVTANAVKPAVAVLNVTLGADVAVDEAARRLIQSGVTLVTVSGVANNDGDEDSMRVSPGRLPEAITVARSIGNFVEHATVRTGPNVDLFSMASTMAIGSGSAEYDPTHNEAGLVAGAAALILSEHPTWTPAQVQQILVANATPNLIRNLKQGSPNLTLYVGP